MLTQSPATAAEPAANEHTLPRPAYCLAADVLLVPVPDGSARLIDLHGKFFALSETAGRMLQDTLELGLDAAADNIARRWNIGRDRAHIDLAAFVARLLQQRLLMPVDRPQRRTPLRRRLAATVVSALVRITRRLRPSLKGKVSGLLTAAKLSCRWLGWADTVALWQRLFARPTQALKAAADDALLTELDAAVRRAVEDSVFAHACKERGLAAWALGRSFGLDVRLIIGLSLCPVHGHCWAQLGDAILGDDDDQCGQYQPVQSYA